MCDSVREKNHFAQFPDFAGALPQDCVPILATAYLRFLAKEATNRPTTGHLAGSKESSENTSETAIALRKTSVMSPEASQDGGRNANPSKELR